MAEEQQEVQLPRFLSDDNYDLQEHIDNVMTWFCGESFDDSGNIVPKLGVYSLLAHGSNAFVWDNPAFTEMMGCRTAFTDGVYTYYNADFLRELVELDARDKTDNVLFVILHEYSHMLLRHEFRSVEYTQEERNIGFDLFINTMLQIAFPKLRFSKSVWDRMYGFKPGDERYASMAEEDIVREIHKDMKKAPKLPQMSGSNGPGQGQPGQGQSQPSQNKPSKGQPGKGQKGQGETGSGYDPSLEVDNHVVTPQDVVDALNNAGLGHVADIFDIPRDQAGQEGMQKDAEARLIDAANRISDMTKRGFKIPGGHVMDHVGEVIKALSKPKITWKLPFRGMVLGTGMHSNRAPEIPNRMVAALSQQGQRTFLPSYVPARPNSKVVFIIDTSASMRERELREPIEEGLGLLRQGGSRASEIAYFFCDTALRGEPFILTLRNAEEIIRSGMEVLGRGGTNLERNLRDVMDSKYVQEAIRKRQLAGVMMFSDLGDKPLLREKVHKDTPKNFTVVATSGSYSETWARASTACETFPIETRPSIDMTRRM